MNDKMPVSALGNVQGLKANCRRKRFRSAQGGARKALICIHDYRTWYFFLAQRESFFLSFFFDLLSGIGVAMATSRRGCFVSEPYVERTQTVIKRTIEFEEG